MAVCQCCIHLSLCVCVCVCVCECRCMWFKCSNTPRNTGLLRKCYVVITNVGPSIEIQPILPETIKLSFLYIYIYIYINVYIYIYILVLSPDDDSDMAFISSPEVPWDTWLSGKACWSSLILMSVWPLSAPQFKTISWLGYIISQLISDNATLRLTSWRDVWSAFALSSFVLCVCVCVCACFSVCFRYWHGAVILKTTA